MQMLNWTIEKSKLRLESSVKKVPYAQNFGKTLILRAGHFVHTTLEYLFCVVGGWEGDEAVAVSGWD